MPTQTILPDASVSGTWSFVGSDFVSAITSADSDTSYAYRTPTDGSHRVSLGNLTALPAGAVISEVQVNVICKRVGGAGPELVLMTILGVSTDTKPPQSVGAVYGTISGTFTTKPGGGAWTESDVNSLEIQMGATSLDGVDDEVRVTAMSVVVTYTEAGGSNWFFGMR